MCSCFWSTAASCSDGRARCIQDELGKLDPPSQTLFHVELMLSSDLTQQTSDACHVAFHIRIHIPVVNLLPQLSLEA